MSNISSGVRKPVVNFIGNSSTDVTGSCHQIKFKNYNILLDAGLIQTNNIVTDYKANRDFVKKIKPKEVHYIICSHLHADHIGLLPPLYAKGCQAHIYIPSGSLPIMKLMLEDSAKIMQQDSDKLTRKHGIKAPPLATLQDVEKVLDRCIEVCYNLPMQIAEGVTFTYYPAGHIIHSAQIYLELKEGYVTKRVGYTGDIGSLDTHVSVEPRQDLPFVNVLIGEATYCQEGRNYSIKKDRWFDRQLIIDAITDYNKILIPVFSLQRTEDILHELYQLDDKNGFMPTVYLDAPLASKIFNAWDGDIEYLRQWGKLKIIGDYVQSQGLQTSNEHCIIVSSSGMLTAGRALSHLKTILPNPKNCILFCGYSGDSTLATEIKHGTKEIKLDGELIANKAQIYCLNTFSSHVNYSQLSEYYKGLSYDKLVLTHGRFEGKVKYANKLQEELTKEGKSSRVICANEDSRIYI